MSRLSWAGGVRRVDPDSSMGVVTGIGLSLGGGERSPPPEPPRRSALPPGSSEGANVAVEPMEPADDPRSHRTGRFKLG